MASRRLQAANAFTAMKLIHSLLSLPEVPVAHLGDSDFSASNGMPIPYDPQVHRRLSVAPYSTVR